MISVSLVILTWNRQTSVEESLAWNLYHAGYPVYEIVHVDNGSEPGFAAWFNSRFSPSVQVLHGQNQGVARGYNRGLAMTTGSHVVITGCDRKMPKQWLAAWVDAFHKIPNTGVISCYTGDYGERWRGNETVCNGVKTRRSIPVEARMHSKNFLYLTGFWREDFGLYGFEDAEWSDRAEKRAMENGLINYILPDLGKAEHLPDTDFPKDLGGQSYKDYKQSIQYGDNRRRDLWLDCHLRNSPYYNPYARHEPNLLDAPKIGVPPV